MRSQQLTTFLLKPTTMRRRYQNTGLRTSLPPWERFASVRSKDTGGDYKLLLNHVSLTIPGLCTHRDLVEAIARQSQVPFAIQALADVLSQTKLPRSKVIFSFVGDEIDKIATNYDGMHWWISKEGLNMAIVPPRAANLSRFDEFAGNLCVDKWKDGKLSKDSLVAIAKEVDVARFTLKEELQPAQWKPIAEYNKRNPRQPIKTFEKVSRNLLYVRSVRRRLYVARERYIKANFLDSSLSSVS